MNLSQSLQDTAKRFSGKTALVTEERVLSYAELDGLARGLARRWRADGLRPGDRVAVHGPNTVETTVSILACFHSGLVAAPVNIRFKPAEVAYVLQHAGARRAVVHPSLAEAVRGVQADCPNLEQIDIKLPESAAGRDEGEVEDDAAALLLYTSGTTAQPKGVTHTPQTLQASAETMRPLGFDETSVVLVSMSMMHTAGLCGSLLPTLVTGGKAVLLPRFEAGELLDLVEKHRCTWSLVLPALLQALAVEQERRPRDLGSMRAWLSGGDAVPVSLQE